MVTLKLTPIVQQCSPPNSIETDIFLVYLTHFGCYDIFTRSSLLDLDMVRNSLWKHYNNNNNVVVVV
jgi:hypothetical protein